MPPFDPAPFWSRNHSAIRYCTSACKVQQDFHFRGGTSETNLGASGLAASPSLEVSVSRVDIS